MILTEAIGWCGALALLLAHGLVTDRRVSPAGWPYLTLNVAGAAGLALNGAAHGAWPSAALNLLWLGIGARAVAPAARGRFRRWTGRRSGSIERSPTGTR